MTKKILVIDDDTTLLELVKQYLSNAGYQVTTAAGGLKGLQVLYNDHPDLIVLDVMMPRMDGWQVCGRVREVTDVPIIMLTAKDQEVDRLKGFQLGVDDYMSKPFSFPELAARIKAILSRTGRMASQHQARTIAIGDLLIDLKERRVSKGSQTVQLTPTEYKLLALLAAHARHVLSTDQILRHVWGDEYIGEVGYVKRYIWYVRQKIEDDPTSPKYLLTERGFGYSLGRDF